MMNPCLKFLNKEKIQDRLASQYFTVWECYIPESKVIKQNGIFMKNINSDVVFLSQLPGTEWMESGKRVASMGRWKT